MTVRVKNLARLAALTAGVSLVLSACGSSEPQAYEAGGCPVNGGPVGLALAGRANMPPVSGTPQFESVVMSAVENQSHVSIYDTGGEPVEAFSKSLQLTSANDGARQDERKDKLGELETAILGMSAKADEANPLKAMALAADSVRANGSSGTVLVMDSGLSTTPPLDYQDDSMFLASPDELAQQAKASGQLPDLTGMTVVLVGIGATAPPQAPLDTATRKRLQDQWVTMAESAGAACVSLDPTPLSGAPKDGLPSVSPVDLPAPTQFDLDEPVALRSDVLEFHQDSAELMDADGSKAALQPLAESLNSSAGRIVLTGTTATWGTRSYRLELSQQRADATKALLVELGVDADRIQTKGVGTDHPSHVDDLDANGDLLAAPAAKNRAVFVEVVA